MVQRKEKLLANLELKVMKVVWRLEKATVREVKKALPRYKPLAYTTVLTVMRNLEKKGFLRHDVAERTYVYYPVVSREEAISSMLRNMANRLFDGSAGLLMVHVLESQKLSQEDLRKLKQLITSKQKTAQR